MSMFLAYIHALNAKFATGLSTEHTFRGDLQNLLAGILPADYVVMNEPKRQACGAPDYIIEKNGIAVGFIEAKDIGDKDLLGEKKTGNKAQFDRYKSSLPNLIFTDYLTFHFYHNGELKQSIEIGKVENNKIIALENNFSLFENLIKDFVKTTAQTIKSPKKLAEMMASKARLLANVIEEALNSDDENHDNSSLHDQMQGFKQILIHDISNKGFADVYAQTITYGLFASRLHDNSLNTFSRQEAMELIPKSNPFLRNLFSYISGVNIDDRIKWIVDSLAEVFLHCNIKEILKDYGKSTKTNEPIIHFYETFLSEYDSGLRKARGVWYTPAPVVDFIVRAVDDVLKNEFGLMDGLADDSKTTIEVKSQTKDARYKDGIYREKKDIHKVQILDPATGTGTFLSAVVRHIHNTQFAGQQGVWSSYVENDLIPRLNGFEILMASYAMAHLQLDLLLTETGYVPNKTGQRFRIYLTNSLEESHADTGTLFTSWLSNEATEANFIKRDTPVMVVMGNPPYSGESANKGEWIMNLMDDYKKEPNSKEKLKEKNPKWINDDYVKFIRYGQYFIGKNNSGVLAFINPHGFLDNPTFRGVRYSLLQAFDKIYTIDLHGNAKKKETAPDGSIDENVFDIMQGVSINIFIKTGKKKKDELAQVYHYDLYGKREVKYDFLTQNNLADIDFNLLENHAPNYFMVKKDFGLQKDYEKGFAVNDLFLLNNVGIVTSRDGFVIDFEKSILEKRIKDFFELDKEKIQRMYDLKENKTWKIDEVKQKIGNFNEKFIENYVYRPFDIRSIYYHDLMIERSRNEVMQHFLIGNNIGLVFKLGNAEENSVSATVTKNIIDFRSWSRAGMQGGDYVAPLYLYFPTLNKNNESQLEKSANFNPEILKKLENALKLQFVLENGDDKQFTALQVLDYLYAVLHSPTYRETYQEFLKIDFPRIPYPKNSDEFFKLATLGSELRALHLMTAKVLDTPITEYPVVGDNVVGKIKFFPDNEITGKVYINDSQYFDKVPKLAWEFYIGGYQPAQKWLKDRKDRALTRHDIRHYGRIIVALSKTAQIMPVIDEALTLS
ncbi:N-6 DNA methylase [Moraxella bovis]|uniref:type ISP restriction/modification enzyme n=1 Tax=Moraxella bovis TaxID=476 RepID=UPI000991A667|nr:type ISP restriction/modification enzyme [Moraxella bovis]UZA17987.1 N-6 DNA methylase [Moraxella bovis]